MRTRTVGRRLIVAIAAVFAPGTGGARLHGAQIRRSEELPLDHGLDPELLEAASLQDLELPMLLPGIRVNTTQTDYYPVEQLQLIHFDGTRWVRFGEVMGR